MARETFVNFPKSLRNKLNPCRRICWIHKAAFWDSQQVLYGSCWTLKHVNKSDKKLDCHDSQSLDGKCSSALLRGILWLWPVCKWKRHLVAPNEFYSHFRIWDLQIRNKNGEQIDQKLGNHFMNITMTFPTVNLRTMQYTSAMIPKLPNWIVVARHFMTPKILALRIFSMDLRTTSKNMQNTYAHKNVSKWGIKRNIRMIKWSV